MKQTSNGVKFKLIIGLGNPGEEYANTRHNAGFLVIDKLAGQLNAEFRCDKKLLSEIVEAEFSIFNFQFPNKSKISKSKNSTKILLARPMTFMNKSGSAVAALAKFHKIKPENILVIHDDIDIPWGNFKLSFGRSSAGHKGVESIIKALKTKNFWRLRIGIQPARNASRSEAGGPTLKKHTPADKIILKKFTPAELKILDETIKKIPPKTYGGS